MDYQHMTAPCGLACFNCLAYLGNEDEKMRILISRQFGLALEKAVCNGCREEDGKCIVTGECPVYPCAEKRGVTFCYECPDFPCDAFHPYADQADKVPHNTKVFNLCLIKKMGVDKWAEQRAKNVKEVYFRGKWKI